MSLVQFWREVATFHETLSLTQKMSFPTTECVLNVFAIHYISSEKMHLQLIISGVKKALFLAVVFGAPSFCTFQSLYKVVGVLQIES